MAARTRNWLPRCKNVDLGASQGNALFLFRVISGQFLGSEHKYSSFTNFTSTSIYKIATLELSHILFLLIFFFSLVSITLCGILMATLIPTAAGVVISVNYGQVLARFGVATLCGGTSTWSILPYCLSFRIRSLHLWFFFPAFFSLKLFWVCNANWITVLQDYALICSCVLGLVCSWSLQHTDFLNSKRRDLGRRDLHPLQ